MMRIELIRATAQHRSAVRQLYELYCHDFSPMTKSDVGEDGYWTGDNFLTPWPDDRLQVFLIRVNEQWAGFAWIARGSYLNPAIENHYLMDEFFIMRKYRRQGLGEQVAVRLFNKFSGVWEVGEIPENIEAQVFWRLIIGRYTDNHFHEVNADSDLWRGPVQTFRTP